MDLGVQLPESPMLPAPLRSGPTMMSSTGISVNAVLRELKALHRLLSALAHARTWNWYLLSVMPLVVILPTARLRVVAGAVEVKPAWLGRPEGAVQVVRLLLVLTLP